MKKIIYLTVFVFIGFTTFSQSILRVSRYNNIGLVQTGPLNNGIFTIGKSVTSASNPNNGSWSLEYLPAHSSPGLNIWKPWPTSQWGNFKMYIRDNGNVGINCDGDNLYRLKVNGSIFTLSGTITGSDQRYKTKVEKMDNSLETLLKINTYSYKFIQPEPAVAKNPENLEEKVHPALDFDKSIHYGVIAQEIQTILPDLVIEDDNGYLGVNYTELIPLLIGAVQEQNKQIVELQNEVKSLKQKQ